MNNEDPFADDPFADVPVLPHIGGLKPASEYTTVTTITKDNVTRTNGTAKAEATVVEKPVTSVVDPKARTLSNMFVVGKVTIKAEVTRSPLSYNKVSASAEVELDVLDNDVPLSSIPKLLEWIIKSTNATVDAGCRGMIQSAKAQAEKHL
jgi:hypothetical protein